MIWAAGFNLNYCGQSNLDHRAEKITWLEALWGLCLTTQKLRIKNEVCGSAHARTRACLKERERERELFLRSKDWKLLCCALSRAGISQIIIELKCVHSKCVRVSVHMMQLCSSPGVPKLFHAMATKTAWASVRGPPWQTNRHRYKMCLQNKTKQKNPTNFYNVFSYFYLPLNSCYICLE